MNKTTNSGDKTKIWFCQLRILNDDLSRSCFIQESTWWIQSYLSMQGRMKKRPGPLAPPESESIFLRKICLRSFFKCLRKFSVKVWDNFLFDAQHLSSGDQGGKSLLVHTLAQPDRWTLVNMAVIYILCWCAWTMFLVSFFSIQRPIWDVEKKTKIDPLELYPDPTIPS